jgi:hypothetical protein
MLVLYMMYVLYIYNCTVDYSRMVTFTILMSSENCSGKFSLGNLYFFNRDWRLLLRAIKSDSENVPLRKRPT